MGATFDLPAEVWDEYGDAETKRWARALLGPPNRHHGWFNVLAVRLHT